MMYNIEKAPETTTSRERVVRTFNFEKTDRVTIGYEANAAIDAKLKAALGLAKNDHEGLLEALGVDYRPISAPYIGPQLFEVPEGRMVNQLEGSIMRWVEHQSGGYWDFCDFPLKSASPEDFATFPVPNPDDFDYDAALEQAKAYGGKYALYVGSAGVPDIINSNGRIMGMEDILCYLITEDEAAMSFVKRRADFQLKNLERLLDKCKGYIDFMWLGEDLGTQIAPMVSLQLYRKVMKPIHKMFADLANAYGIPSIIHTCGSSSWAYEDFIEIGIKGVDTLQPEAVNMSPAYLAEKFGGRLNFRGCISTAGPLAYGTVEDVRKVCKETLEIMMACRGYHFAPTHAIQDNTLVENVVAMYQSAHDYGRY
jgi:uroporphyrinogen decarboxylase